MSQYDGGNVMTYGDLARRIARTHMFFQDCGLKPGQKVALLGKNSVSWIVTYMATLSYGAVVVPILQDFNHIDAQHIINHSESVMLFVSDSIWENLDFDSMPGIKIAISLETSEVLAESSQVSGKARKAMASLSKKFNRKYPYGFRPTDVQYRFFSPDSVAEINYTSGTTGFSKGVMLTLNNLCGNVVFGVRSRLHYRGSRALSFLPLAHAYGCAFDMLVPLAVGTHVTVFGKLPSPKLLIKALNDVRPNLILCVPLILEKIYRSQIQPMLSKPSIRRLLAVPFLRSRVYSR